MSVAFVIYNIGVFNEVNFYKYFCDTDISRNQR